MPLPLREDAPLHRNAVIPTGAERSEAQWRDRFMQRLPG